MNVEMTLIELVEINPEQKSVRGGDFPAKADGGLVRKMLAFAAERIMKFDHQAIGPGDRS